MVIEYYLIKPEDDFCNSEDSLNNLLMSNSKVKIIKNSLAFDGIVIKYQISTSLVGEQNERLFRIILSNEDKDLEKNIIALEKASRIFRKILREASRDFKINTIWDEVAQHYCRLSYPLLNNIENQMRKLIFRFMIENVGSDWVEKAIPQELRESLKKNAERSKITSLIENCLYEADFVHLIQFMFTPYTTICSTKDLFDKLDKAIDMEAVNELKALKPLSNWDRYFSAFIKFDKLEEKWNNLYFFRNQIAHNKLLKRDEYNEVSKLSTQIGKCLEKALSELDKIKVPEVAKEALGKAAIRSIENGLAYGSPTLSGFSGYSGIFEIMDICTICKKPFQRTKPLSISDSKICQRCIRVGCFGIQPSVLGLSVDSSYLSSTAVCSTDLSLGYKPLLGTEKGVSIHSLLLTRICSQCGKSYTPSSVSLTTFNQCPECEQNGLAYSPINIGTYKK